MEVQSDMRQLKLARFASVSLLAGAPNTQNPKLTGPLPDARDPKGVERSYEFPREWWWV